VANPENVRSLLDLIIMYLNWWQGQPSVLMIYVEGTSPKVEAKLQQINICIGADLSYYGLETILVAAVNPWSLSVKKLF
jgi:hypothetical protein